MNKGFTLIEVVAIIVIFAGIFLISFPTLNNMTRSDNEKRYTNMVNNLCIAGETYIYSNLDDFQELSIVGSEIEVSLVELIAYGNVDKNLVNPKTKLGIEESILKYKVLEDLSLSCSEFCEYNEKCEYVEE